MPPVWQIVASLVGLVVAVVALGKVLADLAEEMRS